MKAAFQPDHFMFIGLIDPVFCFSFNRLNLVASIIDHNGSQSRLKSVNNAILVICQTILAYLTRVSEYQNDSARSGFSSVKQNSFRRNTWRGKYIFSMVFTRYFGS